MAGLGLMRIRPNIYNIGIRLGKYKKVSDTYMYSVRKICGNINNINKICNMYNDDRVINNNNIDYLSHYSFSKQPTKKSESYMAKLQNRNKQKREAEAAKKKLEEQQQLQSQSKKKGGWIAQKQANKIYSNSTVNNSNINRNNNRNNSISSQSMSSMKSMNTLSNSSVRSQSLDSISYNSDSEFLALQKDAKRRSTIFAGTKEFDRFFNAFSKSKSMAKFNKNNSNKEDSTSSTVQSVNSISSNNSLRHSSKSSASLESTISELSKISNGKNSNRSSSNSSTASTISLLSSDGQNNLSRQNSASLLSISTQPSYDQMSPKLKSHLEKKYGIVFPDDGYDSDTTKNKSSRGKNKYNNNNNRSKHKKHGSISSSTNESSTNESSIPDSEKSLNSVTSTMKNRVFDHGIYSVDSETNSVDYSNSRSSNPSNNTSSVLKHQNSQSLITSKEKKKHKKDGKNENKDQPAKK